MVTISVHALYRGLFLLARLLNYLLAILLLGYNQWILKDVISLLNIITLIHVDVVMGHSLHTGQIGSCT